MDDVQMLWNLIERGCDRGGLKSLNTRKGIRDSGRSLMTHLGGFEALCLAEPRDIQRWLDSKLGSHWGPYCYLTRINHIYDFLVEEGVIGASPAGSLRVAVPSRDEAYAKPAMDLKDVRRLFGHAKRRSFTLEGAKAYLVLCLRIRCGMQYASMARCRMSDLALSDGRGSLVAFIRRRGTDRQVLYEIDEETVWAFENYFKRRGATRDDEPLIMKHGYHGAEAGGAYCGSTLQDRVSTLCGQCGLKVGDYDLNKTVIMLAYAEGANVLQATSLAAKESLTLAARVAEELPSIDPRELRRRLLEEFDTDEVVAAGMMRSEDIMAAVRTAYAVPCVKVVIGADGWAKFELSDAEEQGRLP